MTTAVERPPIWVGHVTMKTRLLEESEAFMKDIGMRSLFKDGAVAVLELRGGTHLVLKEDPESVPGPAKFDLMVEDIDATYEDFLARNFTVSEKRESGFHVAFEVTEPGGNRITVNSTHVPDHAAV